MTERGRVDSAQPLHPAVERARELRRRTGLSASLTDIGLLSRVNSLFEHVTATKSPVCRDEHDAA